MHSEDIGSHQAHSLSPRSSTTSQSSAPRRPLKKRFRAGHPSLSTLSSSANALILMYWTPSRRIVSRWMAGGLVPSGPNINSSTIGSLEQQCYSTDMRFRYCSAFNLVLHIRRQNTHHPLDSFAHSVVSHDVIVSTDCQVPQEGMVCSSWTQGSIVPWIACSPDLAVHFDSEIGALRCNAWS